MAAPYTSVLQVPDFVPRDQREDYEGFIKMKQDTEGQRKELGLQKMDTLKAMLGKIPGLTDMYEKTTNLVQSMLAGEISGPLQQILQQQGAATAAQHGVGGSQAGANITLAGLGKEAVRTQQQGLLQVPQIMSSLKTTFMGNIASSEDVQGPSWQSWQSQQQADTRDMYQANLGQAKALHQVQQLNEQYSVQEAQREAAHRRMMQAQQASQEFQASQAASQNRMTAALSAQGIRSQVAFANADRYERQSQYLDDRSDTRAQRTYNTMYWNTQSGNLQRERWRQGNS